MARTICNACERPSSVCLCDAICRQDNAMPVLILRHEDELDKPLNTVKLLKLGLSQIDVWDGVHFPSSRMSTWLRQNALKNPVLLYPKPVSDECKHFVLPDGTNDLNGANDIDIERSRGELIPFKIDCLIVLDGTWRNTRELLLVNKWIKSFNTLSIDIAGPSRYRIRQSNQKDSLSTIEAVGQVINVFEEGFDLTLLLKPFQQMIDYQIECMGQETYRRNYLAT